MKKAALLAFIGLALAITSCNEDNRFVIEGSVCGGRDFEDQTIYLSPLSAASVQGNADSAVIHDGRFRFEGTAEQDGVYILRMRPMMRLFIGELYIIREPGRIRAKLNQVSTASGTPQNDSLQAWRDFKFVNDSLLTDIKRKLKKASPDEMAALHAQQDSIKAVFERRCRETVEANPNTAYGDFIDKWYVR